MILNQKVFILLNLQIITFNIKNIKLKVIIQFKLKRLNILYIKNYN